MANDFLGQILGSVLGGGRSEQQGSTGGGFGGLGDLLGGVLGGGGGGAARMPDTNQGGVSGGWGADRPTAGGGMGGLGSLLGGGKGAALTALMVPLAMQWVQRNGGIDGVLQKFKQKGYTQQAASWVSTGQNETLPPEAIKQVVGSEDLSQLSQQLGGGVGNEEVASQMAQILPEVVNKMTPQGQVPQDSEQTLSRGISAFTDYFKTRL